MRREPFLLLMLALGCARGSADLLDASIGPITGADGGSAGDDESDSEDGDGEDIDGPDPDGTDAQDADDGGDGDGSDADGSDADGSDVDASPDDVDGVDDGPVDGDDGEDAGTMREDAGTQPQPIVADFRVRQRNAALDEPLSTQIQLKVGDRLRIQGSGKIWPGLALQGCCGPTGTSGTHSGSEWPLQGGPDFALVAFVNGVWKYVGQDTSFDITVPGPLQLGTNDNDPGTGDDCTTASPGDQGFTAHVVVMPAP
jgi:hypothetical protein